MIASPRAGLLVRPLQPSDRPAVERLTRAVGVFRDEEIPVALEVFDLATGAGPDGRVDPGYEHAGVASGETLVGWAAWGPTPGTDRTFDLYWIVVDPARHGAGIGSALMVEMERRIAGRARLVLIETSGRSDYAGTRGFYERHGYRRIAVIPDFYARGDDRVTYGKALET